MTIGQKATFAALAMIAPAGAAVTAVENLNIPIPATFGGIYINLVNPPDTELSAQSGTPDNANGTYTLSFNEPAGDWDFNFFFGGVGIAHNSTANPYRGDSGDNLSAIHALGIDETIDGSSATASGALPLVTPTFGGSGTGSGGGSGVSTSGNHIGIGIAEFEPGVRSYLGFVLDPGTPQESFGWIGVTFNDNGSPGIIHDFALSDEPIRIAEIPEPSTPALLVFVASLTLVRRKR